MRRRWTTAEDEFLSANYKKVPLDEIATTLSRTRSALYQRVMKELTPERVRRPAGARWTGAEDEQLRKCYGTVSNWDLARAMGRTLSSLHGRAHSLELTKQTIRRPSRPWLPDDERYVLENYGRVPVESIAKQLNRSRASIRQRAARPRNGRPGVGRKAPRWTESELLYLSQAYQKASPPGIAEHLGKSTRSVYSMAHKLGVTRHHIRSPPREWTPTEDDFLRANYGKVRPSNIALSLSRSRNSVYHRAERLGLFADFGSGEFLRRQSLPRTAKAFVGFTNPVDMGYVAGIIDGEGSVVGPPKITLQVNMTTKEVIDRLAEVCGGSSTGPYENRSGRSEVCLPQFHWTVSSAHSVYQILKVLYPYLIVKREKAQAVIEFLERRWSL